MEYCLLHSQVVHYHDTSFFKSFMFWCAVYLHLAFLLLFYSPLLPIHYFWGLFVIIWEAVVVWGSRITSLLTIPQSLLPPSSSVILNSFGIFSSCFNYNYGMQKFFVFPGTSLILYFLVFVTLAHYQEFKSLGSSLPVGRAPS